VFVAWVRGIAANLLRNHCRRGRRSSPIEHVEAAVAPESNARELAEHVACILAELPPRHEAVLRAKYLDGQSVNDIAAAWGESPKAVESLLTRARQAFRLAYGETAPAETAIPEISP
jgi:RNA polymerase sigma-70 factor (ECF subfamily)